MHYSHQKYNLYEVTQMNPLVDKCTLRRIGTQIEYLQNCVKFVLRSVFPSHEQVVILERRSQTGKALYRSVSGGWNGSEEDKYRLHEQLELLQKDPTYLSSDATLPEVNNEMAPVRHLLH